jgi:hypothetical protein
MTRPSGMGVLLSSLWVVGHTYVLYHTEDKELRIQRYVSILLGLSLLLCHLMLCYGSVQERRATVTLFFILSMAVLILYWAQFGYLKYGLEDEEASKEVNNMDLSTKLFYENKLMWLVENIKSFKNTCIASFHKVSTLYPAVNFYEIIIWLLELFFPLNVNPFIFNF